jgi:hypothetical protein
MTTELQTPSNLVPTKTKIVESKAGRVRRITTKYKAPKKGKKIKATRVLKTTPKKTAAKPAKAKAPKATKGVGVIDTIVELLRTEGGISLVDLTAKVAKRFGDRDPASLAKTCRAQLQRLPQPKEQGGRGIKVKKVKQEGTRVKLYLI